jgi:hypothetical protein
MRYIYLRYPDIFILNVVENYEDLKYVLPATIRAEQEADSERSTKSGLQCGDLKVSVEGAKESN